MSTVREMNDQLRSEFEVHGTKTGRWAPPPQPMSVKVWMVRRGEVVALGLTSEAALARYTQMLEERGAKYDEPDSLREEAIWMFNTVARHIEDL